MIYVALLRARRTLIWTALALAVIACVVIVSFVTGNVTMDKGTGFTGLPDSTFAVIALVTGLVIASITATSLARETPTLPVVWTKPQSRPRIALTYFAVDLVAITGAALLAAVAAIACTVPTGALSHLVHDRNLAILVVRGCGTMFMWYAVGQAASAGLPGRGGFVVGVSWPLFLGLVALGYSNVPSLHGVALVLNVINPLAWMSSQSHVVNGAVVSTNSSLYPFLPEPVVIVAPWLLAGLALYLATVLWSRREV